MFMGEYRHTLDDKYRLIVPARFRDELGGRFVLTRGLDRCLFGFPMEEWRRQEQMITQLPMTMADGRAFSRMFFSGAAECELDRQGRTVIPVHLREYANIDKEIVIIGVSSRFEVWSAQNWEEYIARVADSYEAIAEKLVSPA
ncbi:MAG: division/cell wall cluster transcriptional repressor MraZ [Firmicutes bacterium]|nr:division/cell wall cluster transcriptional repressor MraZ [Bacillota bacterium]